MSDDIFDEHLEAPADLKGLTDLCEKLRDNKRRLAMLEAEAKEVKNEIDRIESVDIPDLMDTLNLSEIALGDGKKVKVKDIIKASIPTASAIARQRDPDKREEMEYRSQQGMAWLRDNEGEEIIKNKVVVEFSKGQDNLAGDMLGYASEHGLPAIREESVHSATLSNFVKEKIAKGVDVPLDLLGVYCGRKAEIKS